MGHGTEHAADSSYAVMEQALRAYAQHPVYIATVEGKRTIADVIAQMKFEGIVNTKVIVAPFMLVAGDHANNDMAGEEDSFASLLREEGYVFYVELQNIRQSGKFIYHIYKKLQVRCLRILRHRIVRESFTESV